MAYADGFSPTTLGILFSHTASRYIFLFSYLASTQEEIIPRKQYIIFIEYSRGDTTLTLTTQWRERLVITNNCYITVY